MDGPRIDYEAFRRAMPEAHAALRDAGLAAKSAGIDAELVELVCLRVSQINGCAFCLQLHLDVIRRAGAEQVKLDMLPAWRDAGAFSARERAALDWAESLTRLPTGGAADDEWATVRQSFNEAEAAALTAAIGVINAWNRIAIALRFEPKFAVADAA